MSFNVYVDWTLETNPRPFYVGKGNDSRVQCFKRNRHHTFVSRHLGIRREIVFKTEDENQAFEFEKRLISELGTYKSDCRISLEDVRCNRTLGGDGVSGYVFTDEDRRLLSEKTIGDKNGMFGKHHSEETRKRIGDNQRGWKHTEESKKAIGEAAIRLHTGLKRSEETRRKLSESRKGKSPWNKGKKLGKRDIPRVFSEQARKNISEGCKGRIPWNKGKKLVKESA